MRCYRPWFLLGRDYYPQLRYQPPPPWLDKPLESRWFTNKTISTLYRRACLSQIERLCTVCKLAVTSIDRCPRLDQQNEHEVGVLRLPSILSLACASGSSDRQYFPAGEFYRKIRPFRPTLFTLHHPIWVGSLVVCLLARRLGVPVVYTYHTRLENHYAHFVRLPGILISQSDSIP